MLAPPPRGSPKGDATASAGDLHWARPASQVCDYFPTTLASLRSKSGVCVGVDPEVEAAAAAAHPDKWLVGGIRYGAAQAGGGKAGVTEVLGASLVVCAICTYDYVRLARGRAAFELTASARAFGGAAPCCKFCAEPWRAAAARAAHGIHAASAFAVARRAGTPRALLLRPGLRPRVAGQRPAPPASLRLARALLAAPALLPSRAPSPRRASWIDWALSRAAALPCSEANPNPNPTTLTLRRTNAGDARVHRARVRRAAQPSASASPSPS